MTKIAVRHDCLIEYAEAAAISSDAHVVVLHVANCMCTMGSGVALDIAKAWPEAEQADSATRTGDLKKLGKFSKAVIKRPDFELSVLNLYAQFRYGSRREAHFSSEAMASALEGVAKHFFNQDVVFVFPAMGSGSAGGSWREISTLIVEHLGDWPLYLIKKV